jgi:xylulokinase
VWEPECDYGVSVGEDRLFHRNGNPLDPAYMTGKILWIKENEPEIYRQTYQFLQCNSYIVYRLTGAFTQDLSQGYGIPVFDTEKGKWDLSVCEAIGIDPTKLPGLYPCQEVVGIVSREVSKETGLKQGTPVVAGGLDAACGTLGAGVVAPGDTQEQGGQAGGMSIVLDKPVRCKELILGQHVVKDCWLLQGGTVGGGSLNWFIQQMDAFSEAPRLSKEEILRS